MYQMKRQASEIDEFLQIRITRVRTMVTEEDNHQITSIEHLSNEIFYEIFDYLDVFDLYQVFFNLNSRFQHLISCSSVPLKIKLFYDTKPELLHRCKNIIIPNRHRVLSLIINNDQSLIDDFLIHCNIDESFNRLQSVVIHTISMHKSVLLLFYLKSLPNFRSLTMNIDIIYGYVLSDIYRMIFLLPYLKYNKLSGFSKFGEEYMNISVPLAINKRFSKIEYLIIDHCCTTHELLDIVQHTPQLRYLTCTDLTRSNSDIDTKEPVLLSNLTYIFIETYRSMIFHEFKLFIKKLSNQLQVLKIHLVEDHTYLDADQWEQFIIKHMPHLCQFNLADENFQYDLVCTSMRPLIHSFVSPFWIERQWFSEFVIYRADIHFSIDTYRNIWLDIYKHTQIAEYFNRNIHNNSTADTIPIIQLCIAQTYPDESPQSFLAKFKILFADVQFTRLTVNCTFIPIGLLVRIIYLLSNLDSLNISYLPSIESGWLFDNDTEIRFITSFKNKITKVNLAEITDMEQIHFILYLCPSIQYLQMNISEDMDLDILIRFILIKSSTYTPYLCSLCLTITNADDNIIDQLQKLIRSEKLLTNYMMKRICDHILLKWN